MPKIIVDIGDVYRLKTQRQTFKGEPIYVLVTDVKGEFVHYVDAIDNGRAFVPDVAGRLSLGTRDELDGLYELHRKGAHRERREAAMEKRKKKPAADTTAA